MKKNTTLKISPLLFVLAITSCVSNQNISTQTKANQFDSERALRDVEYQVSLGPRIPNSQAHGQVVAWIKEELTLSGWNPELQKFIAMENQLVNIVGRRNTKNEPGVPWIVLGAHYDSRIFADRDPDPNLRTHAVPGANDGASSVAVLLELSRMVPEDLPLNIWLVFFDGEDNGHISGWDWILGSREFVDKLEGKPDAVVILDMIGDRDLNIHFEKYSDPILSQEIWAIAQELGYSSQFIPYEKHRILDDHIPFLEAGIPSVDIIDFDFPYWHTTSDTIDKVSANSLKIVGETIYNWLIERAYTEKPPSP